MVLKFYKKLFNWDIIQFRYSLPNYENFFFSILLSLLIFSTSAYSQFAPSDLDESFLEGLPPSVREQVETANKVNQDEELDRLFRTDTSIEKNKFILQRLKEEINALEQQILLIQMKKLVLRDMFIFF